MLEKIRDSTKGWFAWVIIILLAIVFTLWGVYGYMGVAGAESETAVNVNGRDIPRVAVERLTQQLQQEAISNGEKVQLDALRQQATDQLIIQMLLLQDAKQRGFIADKKLVDKYMLSRPEFQADGKFSPALFEQLSSQLGYSPYDLRALIADEIVVGQLRTGIMSSAFILPNEVERFLTLQMQTRDVEYITFPVDYFVKTPELSDDEIKQYYESHQAYWQTPEQVNIEYLELTADNAKKDVNGEDIKVTDAEIRAYYDENIAIYTTPEERHIRHILLALPENSSTQQMDAVITQGLQLKEQAQSGVDFATLAKEYSIDTISAEKGGDLGWLKTGVLPEELDKAVFAADANTILDPALTPFGVDIVQVLAIKPAQIQPLEEVSATIAQQLNTQRVQQRFMELQEELATLSYEMPDSLEEVADNMKLTVNTSGFFTADKGAGDPITDNPVVREAAFSELVLGGENSSVLNIAPEHVLVLRIKDHQPKAVKPLDAVHSEVVKAIQDEAAIKDMRAQLDEWMPQINNGDLTTAVVADRLGGGPWKAISKLTRDAAETDAPAVVRDYAFNLPSPVAGHVSAGWLPIDENHFALVLVEQVYKGTVPDQVSAEWKNSADGLTQLQQQADYTAYVQQLRANAEIKRY
jgi:peptidyl-prolyl cis-trans isomerase D